MQSVARFRPARVRRTSAVPSRIRSTTVRPLGVTYSRQLSSAAPVKPQRLVPMKTNSVSISSNAHWHNFVIPTFNQLRFYSSESIQQKIAQDIKSSKVVVYMKGTPEAPQCGFSRRVCDVLRKEGAKFTAYDVLASDELRQGIKDFTSWPTIPQVFIDGEFVGGCDIVEGMHRDGELREMLLKAGAIEDK